jgi:hypothetical protein
VEVLIYVEDGAETRRAQRAKGIPINVIAWLFTAPGEGRPPYWIHRDVI